jgi:aminomethyltransferase
MALAGSKRIDDFGDAAAEARDCRTACAVFDFSFLECARLEGNGARRVVEAFAGCSLETLGVGKIRYALRVGPGGEAVADLTIWRTGGETYEVMSGRHEDISDLLHCAGDQIDVFDVGPDMAMFALQGPASLTTLGRLGDIGSIEALGYFNFGHAKLNGIACRIGRLGYTGEAGFEIITAREHAHALWQTLSVLARPAGFIAADILRIEAGFVLFSNEFRFRVSPSEAGLGKFHQSSRLTTPEILLISFRAEGDSLKWPWEPSRQLKRPVAPDEIAVTSACESIVAGGVLGLGYVLAKTEADANWREPTGAFRNIRRVPMPFYDTAKRRPRAPWR